MSIRTETKILRSKIKPPARPDYATILIMFDKENGKEKALDLENAADRERAWELNAPHHGLGDREEEIRQRFIAGEDLGHNDYETHIICIVGVKP
jgi:hypothetical protein